VRFRVFGFVCVCVLWGVYKAAGLEPSVYAGLRA
jgi:hypothetical protein